jgi:hypothetical protein
MFSAIKSALGLVADTIFSEIATIGGFTVKKQVTASVKTGDAARTRQYFSSEGYTGYGYVGVHMVEPINDPRGIDVRLIGEDGYIHPETLMAALASRGGIARDALLQAHATPAEYMRSDSQISLLVALLSTYHVLLYKESATKPELKGYDDGHVKMDLLDFFAPAGMSATWHGDTPVSVSYFMQTHASIGPERPTMYVANLPGKLAKIVISHLRGRKRTTRLAFDLDIPRLAGEICITEQTVKDDVIDFSSVTAAEVRRALDGYVVGNRLQAAFQAAMAIMMQIALAPVPDVAEGYAWLKRDRTLHLPLFDAWRGSYYLLRSGQPYGHDTEVTSSWAWWQKAGMSVNVQGGMFTALSRWGRYFIESGLYAHDSGLASQLSEANASEMVGAAYYGHAALVTGNTEYCPVPNGIGVNFSPWDKADPMLLPVSVIDIGTSGYELTERNGKHFVVVTSVPPPCSLTHVMGRTSKGGHLGCLSSHSEVTIKRGPRGWMVDNLKCAWTAGIITRLAGYNLEMNYMGKSFNGNWASNASSLASRPRPDVTLDVLPVEIFSLEPRAHVFLPNPVLPVEQTTWYLDIGIDDRVIVTAGRGMRITQRDAFKPPPAIGISLIGRALTQSYLPIRVGVPDRDDFRAQGFRVMETPSVAVPPPPIPLPPPLDLPLAEDAGTG